MHFLGPNKVGIYKIYNLKIQIDFELAKNSKFS